MKTFTNITRIAAMAAMILAFALNGCGEGKKNSKTASFFPIDIAQIQFGADIETVKQTLGIKHLETSNVRFVFLDNVLETTEFGKTVQFGFYEDRLAEVHIKFSCDSSEILEKNIAQLCNGNSIKNTEGHCQESKWNYKGKSIIIQRTCCSAELDDNYLYGAAHLHIYPENLESLFQLDINLPSGEQNEHIEK
jgi:hypothetical protein